MKIKGQEIGSVVKPPMPIRIKMPPQTQSELDGFLKESEDRLIKFSARDSRPAPRKTQFQALALPIWGSNPIA